MGTFQIAYDDFSGGHYMGNRSAELPRNTWYGTNATLNGKGELIPGGAGYVGQSNIQHAGDFYPASSGIFYGFNYYSDSYFVVTEATTVASVTTQYSRMVRVEGGYGGATTISTTALTGVVNGHCTTTNDFSTTGQMTLYYVNNTNADIRKCTLPIWGTPVDSLVSGIFPVFSVDSIVDYKSRLVVWSQNTGSTQNNRFYYSDNTKTTFNLVDYYEMPGAIQTIIPRANDMVVVTGVGIYSVTGVLGESVNIQLIAPANELLDGMRNAKASGRSIIFLAEDKLEYPQDTRIYQLLGASSAEIARIDVQDYALSYADESCFNLLRGGDIAVWLSNGAFYVQKAGGPFVRMVVSRPNFLTQPQSYIAEPIDAFSGITNQGRSTAACFDDDGNIEIYQFGYAEAYPSPTFTTTLSTTPTSASVQLSEYWHSKPMTVRDLMVEAVYDTTAITGLSSNASVAARIVPTGAIDYSVTQTPTLTSSTQTYTTTLSSVTANGARVLHRFRVDDAIKAYGFYPVITFQGCRIRRVIAIGED
jgi:hypothetical protein